MKNYTKTETVKAEPMGYYEFSGLNPAKCEKPNREGYRVISSDNYTTWMNKETFEKTYKETN